MDDFSAMDISEVQYTSTPPNTDDMDISRMSVSMMDISMSEENLARAFKVQAKLLIDFAALLTHKEFENKQTAHTRQSTPPSTVSVQLHSADNNFPPTSLHLLDDHLYFSRRQCLLREQIVLFRASCSTPRTGRRSPVLINQVGIRCRHCAHLAQLPTGAAFFPHNVKGIYALAMKMRTNHFENGVCSQMPHNLKTEFASLVGRWKTIDQCVGGKLVWERRAKTLGLIDTSGGIRFHKDYQAPFLPWNNIAAWVCSSY